MAYKVSDLDGYPLPPVPAVLPKSKAKPPSPSIAIRMALEAIYPADEVFRERIGSLNNKSSQTGSYHYDKAFVAASIYKYCSDNDIPGLADLEKPLATIKHRLPGILVDYELDRQSRLRKAITDGRKAAGVHTDEP
jgi:hypothetical protein